jgi:hypothetical protein
MPEPERSDSTETETIVYPDERERREAKDRRDAEALNLRQQGASYDYIARELGMSKSVAWESVQRAMGREKAESPTTIRQNLATGLDEILLRMRGIALSRDSTKGEAIRAAEQYIRASERKAKLTGAESPSQRVNVVKFLDEEERRAERDRLDAELEAAGVDLSVLPSIESLAMQMLATRDRGPDSHNHPPIELPEHAESLRTE